MVLSSLKGIFLSSTDALASDMSRKSKMDRNDERIKRALRRRPYVLNPVRVNTPDSVLWPTGKVRRRPKPSTSVQTTKIHKRPPIIVSCGQDQTSGDGWNINPEPLSQSGRVTRLIEKNYDEVISSSNSDDISIDSFTDCESECDDEDHGRRTPLLKVKDEEDGKVAKLEVRDMVEDDDLSLHSFDESDFLRDDGNDASTDDFPEPPKEPQVPLKDHQLIIRLAPITNLSETGRKLLQEMAQEMAGVAPQEGKINKKKKGKAKKRVKQEKANKMQQIENVGESKEEDKKEEKKSLRKRFLQWLLPKLRCSKK
ncbi:uncharacterized protein LOC121551192 [Coregonus clupeaformis]|uniref:uncharacterized protein LOC121551192 n=1 Tax=Coregonus clupeaformis TaxID=59861 RepID=UPI001E1C45E1|nr:uncharacterized protein LOC121551192 [Coregonus clupeaformis]